MVRSVSDWVATHFFMWDEFDTRKRLKVKKKIMSVKDATQAIVFYPYWTGNSSFYDGLATHFPNATTVFYDYPNEVYSEDVKVSLSYIREVISDSVSLIRQLRRDGIKEIILVGSSTGSNFAFKIATMVRVEKVVLNMMDRDFAKTIFASPALAILRAKLERKGFTLPKLKKVYKFISVDAHLKSIKSKDTKFLFFVSKSDIFTPAKYFTPLYDKMNKLKIDYNVYTNYFFGHVFGMYKNINSSRIRNFIED